MTVDRPHVHIGRRVWHEYRISLSITCSEHNRNYVGLTNENTKCGSSATIEQLKQRVEQHCYKSAPHAMRHLYQEMPQHSRQLRRTIYPKKYAHGFVVLCFVVVMQSFIMNSHEVFIHIHQGCFAGTGAIVRLPQCQWSKPDGYEKTVNV